jgi:hypothetical protein
MMTASIQPVADLDTWSKHTWTDGLQVDALPDLETLMCPDAQQHIRNYRAVRRATEVLVRGGRFFPEYTSVRVAGSSLSGSFLKLHGIYLGFSVEL